MFLECQTAVDFNQCMSNLAFIPKPIAIHSLLPSTAECTFKFAAVCFVTPPKSEQSIFGFSEFVQAFALLALVYTFSDVRYRFNDCVQELWLFGSRAKGTSLPDSDVDIAIKLMPPTGKTNWALAAYIQFFDDWKQQLRDVLSWDVSLTAIGPDFDMDAEVRKTGVVLWRRG